ANFQGVRNYVAAIRNSLGTRWGYVAFFTKYPVHHFAYASKPRLVMHYENDGWGPDNIDRVFTSGRRRGCPRRPPTPPYVRFRIRRFSLNVAVVVVPRGGSR